MGKDTTSKSFVFHRLKENKQPKPIVITIANIGEMSSSTPPSLDWDLVFNHLCEINDFQSSILSRMKWVSTLNVKTDDSLKVKTHTLVLTSRKANAISKERTTEEEQASCNHVTVQEANDLNSK